MSALGLYGALSLSLSAASLVALAGTRLLRMGAELISPRTWVLIQRSLLVAALLAPFLRWPASGYFRFEAPIKVWSASSYRDFPKAIGPAPQLELGVQEQRFALPLSGVELWLALFVAMAAAFWLRDFVRLWRLHRSSWVLRRIGRVRVDVSERIAAPLSYILPGCAVLALPPWILERPAELRMAVLHELQHHRAGDTREAHVWALLKALFFWNPLLRLWERSVQESQEWACDEALVGRKGVSPLDYAHCLLEAAQRSIGAACSPAGTTGLAWTGPKGYLRRRLQRMSQESKIDPKVQKWAVLGIVVFGLAALSAGSWAAQNLVADSRITAQEAAFMADRAARGTEFPIVVNERVVEQLNRYVGTPDGRAFFRDAMERMEALRPLLQERAEEYGAPWELMAIPVIESGYRNLDESKNPNKAAGLWQFIRSTGRNFGLRVDSRVDERLDKVKATDAALRYLSGLKLRFQHWHLAVLSYNTGEGRVQQGIDETGSRDAFKLIDEGFEGDPNYLAKFMAAVLILKNPAVLE
jgi:membrane-bound lytic murein transglycosylase D